MVSTVIFIAAFIILALFIRSFLGQKKDQKPNIAPQIKQKKSKPQLGHIQIFFASQTGISAKMAEGLGEQAAQKGFQPEVVDLKDITFDHFDVKGDISIFLLSNTGEGQVPDNGVKFMKVLKDKQDLHEEKVVDWKKLSYTVFGLGNTQYQFYNKVGIDTDAILQKKGAQRIYRLGLGDNNASLQDDIIEWKSQLWDTLIQFRNHNPLEREIVRKSSKLIESQQLQMDIPATRKYISNIQPTLANFRLFICDNESEKFSYTQDDLDFKTKGCFKFKPSKVKSIRQARQNTNDGSTLDLAIELQGQPEYPTAGNIALYPKNDPKIVQQIIQYFSLTETQLESKVSIEKVDLQKKLKLNFIPYLTLRQILQNYIDLQGRITKSTLKKLSKFQSIDMKYFSDNSSPKTTAQFRRITQNTADSDHWYYIFRFIRQYKVNIAIQDFLQLSDSMAPRLFTIASSWKKEKHVVVSASLVDNGLISKFFLTNPKDVRAQFRSSSFTDAMKWKKLMFISAGTGFAPFRGFLQDKQLLTERSKNHEDVNVPEIILFFGCKHQQGDFIYKEEVKHWIKQGVINRFEGAFSRDSQKKIYVQHLLEKNEELIQEFCKDQTFAIYVCGSLSMGHDVNQVLAKKLGGHDKIKELETSGRIVKELW